MGEPVPFGLRIFSTLNSTGPAADFFAMTIVFALPFCRLSTPWIWPFMMLAGSALMLTLVRASWVALIFGVVVYLLTSPRRFRTLPFIALYGAALFFLVASLPAFLGAGQDSDIITTRIATLGDVSHDSSALARTSEITDSIRQGLADPLGEGLGHVGSASALSANPSSASGNNLDSGYLARFLELGWLGFAGYLFVVLGSLAAMVAALMRGAITARGAESRDVLVNVAVAAGICAALVWLDAAGDSHLGLDGLFFWMALGIGLRRRSPGLQSVVKRAWPRRGTPAL
jgi:putative inorganic carbon (HCO3(-)) transporter